MVGHELKDRVEGLVGDAGAFEQRLESDETSRARNRWLRSQIAIARGIREQRSVGAYESVVHGPRVDAHRRDGTETQARS